MKIVAISAKIGCGKSTTCKRIAAGYAFPQIASFARLLKEECAEALGFPAHLCYTEDGKNALVHIPDWFLPYCKEAVQNSSGENSMATVRQCLQGYGTEYRRGQNSDYWVSEMNREILEARKQGKEIFLIDDLRFVNEAKYVINQGGYLFRIEPHPEWIPGPHADHESETALDEFVGWSAAFRPEYSQGALAEVALSMLGYMQIFPRSMVKVALAPQERRPL